MSKIAHNRLTRLEYMYRDADNFKSHGNVLLEGALLPCQVKDIIHRLEGGEFFIAEQVGLPPLFKSLYHFTAGPTLSDHCWHEFVRFCNHDEISDYTQIWGKAEVLLARFQAVAQWDLLLSPHSAL